MTVFSATAAIAEASHFDNPLSAWPPGVCTDPIPYLRAAKYQLLRRPVTDRPLSTIQALVLAATHESLALSDGPMTGFAPALIAQAMIHRELALRLDCSGGVWRRSAAAVEHFDSPLAVSEPGVRRR